MRKGEKEKRNLAFWKLESLKYQLNAQKFTIPIIYRFTSLAVIKTMGIVNFEVWT